MDDDKDQPFLVRDATFEELDEIAGVLKDSYEEYGPAVAAQVAEGHSTDLANLREVPEDLDLIVAVRNGELVGSVSFYRNGSRYASGWPPDWPAIRLLAVRPCARAAGIGRALTMECVFRARQAGAKRVGLHTTSFMDAARSMYERIGFRRLPALDVEYAPGSSVLGYVLEL
ncbi:MAG: GNAT family N-acetyltransferase [Actinomycetota bacterium]|nr:GNAT family N-acetyltransferase [Actinomycetota bacterium]